LIEFESESSEDIYHRTNSDPGEQFSSRQRIPVREALNHNYENNSILHDSHEDVSVENFYCKNTNQKNKFLSFESKQEKSQEIRNMNEEYYRKLNNEFELPHVMTRECEREVNDKKFYGKETKSLPKEINNNMRGKEVDFQENLLLSSQIYNNEKEKDSLIKKEKIEVSKDKESIEIYREENSNSIDKKINFEIKEFEKSNKNLNKYQSNIIKENANKKRDFLRQIHEKQESHAKNLRQFEQYEKRTHECFGKIIEKFKVVYNKIWQY
jgi:hypothetical protein